MSALLLCTHKTQVNKQWVLVSEKKVVPQGFSVPTNNPNHLQHQNTTCSLLPYKKRRNSFPLQKQTLNKNISSPDWYNLISTSNVPVIHQSSRKRIQLFQKHLGWIGWKYPCKSSTDGKQDLQCPGSPVPTGAVADITLLSERWHQWLL